LLTGQPPERLTANELHTRVAQTAARPMPGQAKVGTFQIGTSLLIIFLLGGWKDFIVVCKR
jgi:hypothetical protein